MGIWSALFKRGQQVLAIVLVIALQLSLVACAKPTQPRPLLETPGARPNQLGGNLEEVSPPEALQTLKGLSDVYAPQVRILSPRPEEVVENTTVSVRFQVRGLPLYTSEEFGVGPHLHVFIDDQPYRAVYDLSTPLVFENLAPGTHTLRAFASRPWHESFKNEGAFAQRTFHVYAKTPQKGFQGNQPLLTYSRPQGTYGAEPIMLDFYLTNAPLHMIAQEDNHDDIPDWRIRCTVNGQSFVFDQWQPIYLKGFKSGDNWVQLELIDDAGQLIDNTFNNTVRVIQYEPAGDDTLSKLVRGELRAAQVASIIVPDYEPPAEPEPEPEAEPTLLAPETEEVVEPLPTAEEAAEEAVSPSEPEAAPSPEPIAPAKEEAAEVEKKKTGSEITPVPEASEAVPEPSIIQPPDIQPTDTETPEVNLEPADTGSQSESAEVEELIQPATPSVETLEPETASESQPPTKTPSSKTNLKQRAGKFFQRFRRQRSKPAPEFLPEPEVEEAPTTDFGNQQEEAEALEEELTPAETLAPPEPTPTSEATPSSKPASPSELAPISEPASTESTPIETFEEASPTEAPEEPSLETSSQPEAKAPSLQDRASQFFQRFQRSRPQAPSKPPESPKAIEEPVTDIEAQPEEVIGPDDAIETPEEIEDKSAPLTSIPEIVEPRMTESTFDEPPILEEEVE